MAEHDDTHVSPGEALGADHPLVGDGTPKTAPDVLPPGRYTEPVAIGGLAVLTAGVTALTAAGVPWYAAVGFVAFSVVVTAWQRHHVTPR